MRPIWILTEEFLDEPAPKMEPPGIDPTVDFFEEERRAVAEAGMDDLYNTRKPIAMEEENEIAETYRILKEASQKKRANNRENGQRLLSANGIPFEVKNDGAHLIITLMNGRIWDFWPGTGKYCQRHGIYHRGIRNLIAEIKRYWDYPELLK